jgi:ubiquinone/menaquinone biosynthesis C-methylase UbiE
MGEQKDDAYVKALQAQSDSTNAYYKKSIVKTEQQKFLERLLAETGKQFSDIADIACGGGTLSYHLSAIYSQARFSLGDYNPEALQIARETNPGPNFSFSQENIYSLSFPDHSFDLVCCWQTLSWLDEPEEALQELVRITKPGGRIFASSLFNLRHDVDIYAKMTDYSQGTDGKGLTFSYNTYAAKTVGKWLEGKVKSFRLHEFVPEIDFHYEGRGIGTFTINAQPHRLQVSGGYLMNWAVLDIEK